MLPDWAFNLMRLSFKITDIFSSPSRILDEFQIQAGWTVIDYGCGPGRYLKKASEKVGPMGTVFAVDIHDIAIECARCMVEKKGLKNVIPIKALDYFVPIQENTADLIYVLDVFHMISRPTQFLQELHRLVKPGGNLILEDGHQKREKTIAKVLSSRRWKIENDTNRHLVLKPIFKIAN